MKRRSRRVAQTPIVDLLKASSSLRVQVMDGLGAVKKTHRDCIDEGIRSIFADSLDLDEAVKEGHEEENRWDYLLGYASTRRVIGLEPHTAKDDQVSTIIKKRAAARDQLRSHMKDGATVVAWFWVASGSVQFANTEKTKVRLDQSGIKFVGGVLLAKDVSAYA